MSAPSISFNPATMDYGTINAGSSCSMKSYRVKNTKAGVVKAEDLSIYVSHSVNAESLVADTWAYYSNAKDADYVGEAAGKRLLAGSVPAEGSIVVKTKVKIPSPTGVHGTVKYKAQHLYAYT